MPNNTTNGNTAPIVKLCNKRGTVRSSVFVGDILRTNGATPSVESLGSAVSSWQINPLEVAAYSHILVKSWGVQEPPLLHDDTQQH
jgi:hypothetical protein